MSIVAAQLDFDALLAITWDCMGLTRLCTKRRGEARQSLRRYVNIYSLICELSIFRLLKFGQPVVFGSMLACELRGCRQALIM